MVSSREFNSIHSSDIKTDRWDQMISFTKYQAMKKVSGAIVIVLLLAVLIIALSLLRLFVFKA